MKSAYLQYNKTNLVFLPLEFYMKICIVHKGSCNHLVAISAIIFKGGLPDSVLNSQSSFLRKFTHWTFKLKRLFKNSLYCSSTFTLLNKTHEQICASSNIDYMQYTETPLVPSRLKWNKNFFFRKSPHGSESGPFKHLHAFSSQNVNPSLGYYGG